MLLSEGANYLWIAFPLIIQHPDLGGKIPHLGSGYDGSGHLAPICETGSDFR
jgi:hypothetical protein